MTSGTLREKMNPDQGRQKSLVLSYSDPMWNVMQSAGYHTLKRNVGELLKKIFFWRGQRNVTPFTPFHQFSSSYTCWHYPPT